MAQVGGLAGEQVCVNPRHLPQSLCRVLRLGYLVTAARHAGAACRSQTCKRAAYAHGDTALVQWHTFVRVACSMLKCFQSDNHRPHRHAVHNRQCLLLHR